MGKYSTSDEIIAGCPAGHPALVSESLLRIAYAVGFYTGSEAKFSKTASGWLLVEAAGYYAAVGA